MQRRHRILSFGGAAALTVIGFLCIVLVDGVTGDVTGFALFSAGLIGAISLAFLEVGLSEDRQRADDRKRRR